jgi:hypothetical protein
MKALHRNFYKKQQKAPSNWTHKNSPAKVFTQGIGKRKTVGWKI